MTRSVFLPGQGETAAALGFQIILMAFLPLVHS